MNPPMPESVRYLDLPAPEQVKLLHGLAPVLGRRAEILEKDIWLCQVLDLLFALPQRKPMAFKGGTSLSKGYKLCWRYAVIRPYRSTLDGVGAADQSSLIQAEQGDIAFRLNPKGHTFGLL